MEMSDDLTGSQIALLCDVGEFGLPKLTSDRKRDLERLISGGYVRPTEPTESHLRSAFMLTAKGINSVAQFERDLLIERTQSGLKRAKAAGEVFGRPPTLTESQRAAVQAQIAAGASVSALAKRYGTSRQTVMRARDAGPPIGGPCLVL
jgi:DNA invertase Pin-like site-specific DNA recombinase